MKWKAEVERIENGYLLTVFDVNDEGDEIEHTTAFQEKESFSKEQSRLNKIEAFKNLLWELTNHFGIYHDKHSDHNLEIKITGVEEDG